MGMLMAMSLQKLREQEAKEKTPVEKPVEVPKEEPEESVETAPVKRTGGRRKTANK